MTMTTWASLLAALISLFLVVSVGSVVPVLPTGAAVSGTAAVAAHRDLLAVLAVIAIGALAAYAGDIIMYAICRLGGEAVARRVRLRQEPIRLAETVLRGLETRPLSTLLVSRLVPAGRLPTMLAAAVLGLSWRRFAFANITACVLWSAMYAAIGLLGGAVFPHPWQGVVAAILLVLAFSQLVSLVQRRRATNAAKAAAKAAAAKAAASEAAAEAAA